MRTIACVFPEDADPTRVVVMNADQLRIALVQTDLYWEDVTANLASLEERIMSIENSVDMIVLPEMFTTGFSMDGNLAEPMNLTTTRWMQQMAARTGALLIGSFIVKESGKLYNRACCVFPDHTIRYYDKRHLFRMGAENDTYTGGAERIVIEWKGWRICPLICYDLRFPVWSRNDAEVPFDLLVYIANWPARRAHAWNTLLQARAIENLCYVAGVNRVGTDGKGLSYQGDSVLLDFLGEPRVRAEHHDRIVIGTVSKTDLIQFRSAFPAHLDADSFEIR